MIRFDPATFRSEFARRVEMNRAQHRRLEKLRDREKLKEGAEQAEQEFMTIAQAAVEATMENIATFDAKLTEYQALTVEEIMFLRQRIDSLLEERQQLMDNAHVLPDVSVVI